MLYSHNKTPPLPQLRSRVGFTLLELVIVVAIIAVLASVVAPNLVKHASNAKVQAARSQMELLGLALEAYRIDLDDYPPTESGLEWLLTRPLDEERARSWHGPYMKQQIPLDPWGREYVYRYPAANDSTSFELMTMGKDGKPGGSEDSQDLIVGQPAVRAR